jgi:hypothetical protein
MSEATPSNRESLLRAVVRIRQDTVRVQRLLRVLTVNETVPAEVSDAVETLERWSRRLLRQERQERR